MHRGPRVGAAYLNEVLAIRLRDQRLQLWCCKGVDETCLGNDEEENLCSSENRQLVSLRHEVISKLSQ